MADGASGKLAADFRRAHQALISGGDPVAGRQQLVELTRQIVTGCDWAALTSWPAGRRPRLLAATGTVPQLLTDAEYDAGDGPSLSATDDEPSWIPDLYAETRWPAFVDNAVDRSPVRSAVMFRLGERPEHCTFGLYAATSWALDGSAVSVGALFATHAAVLLSHADASLNAVQVHRTLATSRRIGTAIGILMATHCVTEDSAFAMLQDASARLDRTLRDVADDINRSVDRTDDRTDDQADDLPD